MSTSPLSQHLNSVGDRRQANASQEPPSGRAQRSIGNIRANVSQTGNAAETMEGRAQQTNGINPYLMTVRETAEYIRRSERAVRHLYERGKLTPLRGLDGRVHIDRREIDAKYNREWEQAHEAKNGAGYAVDPGATIAR